MVQRYSVMIILKFGKANRMSKSKGGKKRTKSNHIYNKTLPKAAMGVRIELGQQGAMGGASL